MNKDNKGLTLIELIVVIAIMAVLTGAFGISFTLVGRQKVSNAATNMKSMLQLAQTYSKSKSECFIILEGRTDGGADCSIFTYDAEGNEKLGNGPQRVNSKITTKVKYADSKEVTIAAGDRVYIRYNRKTGGFTDSERPDGSKSTPVEITFTNGTKDSTLKLATFTGVVTYK